MIESSWKWFSLNGLNNDHFFLKLLGDGSLHYFKGNKLIDKRCVQHTRNNFNFIFLKQTKWEIIEAMNMEVELIFINS